jgi:hypothetical protein
MTERYTLEVKYDSETGDHYLQFTPDMLRQVGWDFGDTIVWKDNEDGSYSLSKKVDNEAGVAQEDATIDGTNSKPTDRDT